MLTASQLVFFCYAVSASAKRLLRRGGAVSLCRIIENTSGKTHFLHAPCAKSWLLFFKAGEQVGHDQNSQDTVACTTALKTSSTALISLALLVSCYDVVVAQGDCSRVEADADRFCKALFFLKVWLQIVFFLQRTSLSIQGRTRRNGSAIAAMITNTCCIQNTTPYTTFSRIFFASAHRAWHFQGVLDGPEVTSTAGLPGGVCCPRGGRRCGLPSSSDSVASRSAAETVASASCVTSNVLRPEARSATCATVCGALCEAEAP